MSVYGFNESDARMVIGLIGGGGSSTTDQTVDSNNPDDGLVLAYTTGTGTARSGTTFGTGTAERRKLSDSNVASATSPTQSYTYLNAAASTIATGKYILLMRVGHKFLCVWEEC
jgi:hypothetical protein